LTLPADSGHNQPVLPRIQVGITPPEVDGWPAFEPASFWDSVNAMNRKRFALVDSRTYAELLYALIGLPLGIAGFVFTVTTLSVSAGLLVTLIGIPILAISLVVARGFGAAYRGLGRSLLGIEVETPDVRRRRAGILGYLMEPHGWRAMGFMLLQFPLAILDFVIAAFFWVYGLAGTTYFIWWRYLPKQRDRGELHGGAELGPHYFLDTPGREALAFVIGLGVLLLAPYAVRGVLALDRGLIRGLLGPTAASKRIESLEETRAMAVEDSAASLRRIERDLHDGAQARLVGLAMSLGLAKEELENDSSGEALQRARQLVESAHREAKGTIVDLRDLARGIHPPALDNGLSDALSTLGARCAIPATVRVDLPQRPSPAVESIVYFCTAELLTNAVKHSGARQATVDVRSTGDRIFLRVGDDGAGGAAAGRAGGSGLAGLADRISTVDGQLTIDSPDGGPTLVTIEIPV
jgi:signal transduction histidine kinase